MGTHDLIKTLGKLSTGVAPVPDLLQSQDSGGEDTGIKILMGNCVSPIIQFLKPILPTWIANVHIPHLFPEKKPESIVIGPNVAGGRIAFIQLPVLQQYIAKRRPQQPS